MVTAPASRPASQASRMEAWLPSRFIRVTLASGVAHARTRSDAGNAKAASGLAAEKTDEGGGESGDLAARPRRRHGRLARSRLPTGRALPRRCPSLPALVPSRDVSEGRTHTCGADLRRTRWA